MKYTLDVMYELLTEKQMADLYSIQKITPYELPINAYQVTIHFQAKKKYSIFAEQILRFLALSSLNEDLLQDMLGFQEEDLRENIALLLADGAIIVNQEQYELTDLGKESAIDGCASLQHHIKTFTCYWEPVTDQWIEEVNQFLPREHLIHPAVSKQQKMDFSHSFLEKGCIQSFYTKVTGESLSSQYEAIQIEDVVYEMNTTNKVLSVQEVCLLSRDQGTETYSIWKPLASQFVRLT